MRWLYPSGVLPNECGYLVGNTLLGNTFSKHARERAQFAALPLFSDYTHCQQDSY
jgi:hypothetical protein